MRGRNGLEIERAQCVDCLRNDALVFTGEMESAHDTDKAIAGKAIARVRHHVDDAGMRARGEHDDAAVLHSHRDEALVQEQRIGLPILPVLRAAVLSWHPGLERGDAGISPLTKNISSKKCCAVVASIT